MDAILIEVYGSLISCLERFGNVRGELKFIAKMLLVWLPLGQVGVGSMGGQKGSNHYYNYNVQCVQFILVLGRNFGGYYSNPQAPPCLQPCNLILWSPVDRY